MDPTAPDTQNAMAETYDQQNITKRVNTPEHDAIAAKALEARTALANYIGNTPWVDANKDNPEAIERAETLVRGGLKSAAAQHTNNANAAVTLALQSGDPAHIAEELTRALSEYKLAAIGWAGYLLGRERAGRLRESLLARASEARAGQDPGHPREAQEGASAFVARDLQATRQALIDVRDSNRRRQVLDERGDLRRRFERTSTAISRCSSSPIRADFGVRGSPERRTTWATTERGSLRSIRFRRRSSRGIAVARRLRRPRSPGARHHPQRDRVPDTAEPIPLRQCVALW